MIPFDGKLVNLAGAKLAAFHRSQGDHVVVRRAGNISALQPQLGDPKWDRVYGSLIFKSTLPVAVAAQHLYPQIVLGGTGWDIATRLPPEVEAAAPDYSDYPLHTYSIGFTQRGCRLECGFCVVPIKEGANRHEATLREIWRGGKWPKQLVLLDNDFFGNPRHPEIIAEARAHDFELSLIQGINARLLSPKGAKLLATVQIKDGNFRRRRVYTAWDGARDEKVLFRGLRALTDAGFSPDMIMVYMLIGYEGGESHADRDYRRQKLRDFGCRPYPMPFVRTGELGAELVAFQRWVVQRADLHVPWERWWGLAKGEPRKLGRRSASLSLFPDDPICIEHRGPVSQCPLDCENRQ